MPRCVFLAGFDPLLLGYEKTENPILPQDARGAIFTRAGIVRPAILLRGTVVGWWKRRDARLTVTRLALCGQKEVEEAALALWPTLRKFEWLEG